MNTDARGGASAVGEEEMEDHVEMEQDSRSNVAMLAARGTFIAGTAAVTVTEARHSTKRHRADENVSEDFLHRRIQDYGLVCPERAKNLVWCFFQKFGSKKMCGVFWRSDARSSCRMMRRSGSSLFILLNPTHCC